MRLGPFRTSRNVPTGPGSRGGQGSAGGRWGWVRIPGRSGSVPTDPGYWRDWRARHPEYMERERRRRLLSKNLERLRRVLAEPPAEPPAHDDEPRRQRQADRDRFAQDMAERARRERGGSGYGSR